MNTKSESATFLPADNSRAGNASAAGAGLLFRPIVPTADDVDHMGLQQILSMSVHMETIKNEVVDACNYAGISRDSTDNLTDSIDSLFEELAKLVKSTFGNKAYVMRERW